MISKERVEVAVTTSDTAEVSAALDGIRASCVVSRNGGLAVPSRYCLPSEICKDIETFYSTIDAVSNRFQILS